VKYITKYLYATKRELQNDSSLINAQTTLVNQRPFAELAAVQTFFCINMRLKNEKGRKIYSMKRKKDIQQSKSSGGRAQH